MELDVISQFSEIIASAAIVASLIFVGLQVRQNTAATRISNAQAALDSWNEVTLSMATNRELAQQQLDGVFPELQGDMQPHIGRWQLSSWLLAGVKSVEHNYLHWLNGNLSEELWQGYRASMVAMFTYEKTTNDFWDDRRDTFSEPFRVLMDSLQVEAAERRKEMVAQIRSAEVPQN